MSHIVEIQTEVRDPVAIEAACGRLKLPPPVQGTHRLFGGEVVGLGVELPGWKYPVVCDTASGQLRYDNYQGRWGQKEELGKFLQAYAIEKVKLEARRRGSVCTEQQLADGAVKLTVQVGVAG